MHEKEHKLVGDLYKSILAGCDELEMVVGVEGNA